MLLSQSRRKLLPGPWVKEGAPEKCEPWCEAVNMEAYKGGNLPYRT